MAKIEDLVKNISDAKLRDEIAREVESYFGSGPGLEYGN